MGHFPWPWSGDTIPCPGREPLYQPSGHLENRGWGRCSWAGGTFFLSRVGEAWAEPRQPGRVGCWCSFPGPGLGTPSPAWIIGHSGGPLDSWRVGGGGAFPGMDQGPLKHAWLPGRIGRGWRCLSWAPLEGPHPIEWVGGGGTFSNLVGGFSGRPLATWKGRGGG